MLNLDFALGFKLLAEGFFIIFVHWLQSSVWDKKFVFDDVFYKDYFKQQASYTGWNLHAAKKVMFFITIHNLLYRKLCFWPCETENAARFTKS